MMIRTLLLLPVALIILGGCRKSPTGGGNEQPVILQGTYVGNGNLGAGRTNLLVALEGPDSLNRFSGDIFYSGVITGFDDVSTDSGTDTVWFRYRRNSVLYRVMALPRSTSLTLHYLEPSGIPVIRVNKEVSGHNLSGHWTGLASSSALQIVDDVVMDMDQDGQLFTGTAEAPSYVLLIMQVNSGVAQGSAFQLAGFVYVSPVTYPVSMVGNYVTHDSVRGFWQVGNPDILDQGEFVFGRSFN